MIDMKEMTLKPFLYKVQEMAMSLQTKQLFCWTKEIPSTSLLTVFAAAKQMNKDRIFWTNSDNDFSIVGIGSTHKIIARSEEHTSELQSRGHLVCRLLLEKKKKRCKHTIH